MGDGCGKGQKVDGTVRILPHGSTLSLIHISGRFRIYVNEYADKKTGKPRKNNKVDEYLPPEAVKQFKAGVF